MKENSSPVVPKLCSADPKRSAKSSQRINGYVSEMCNRYRELKSFIKCRKCTFCRRVRLFKISKLVCDGKGNCKECIAAYWDRQFMAGILSYRFVVCQYKEICWFRELVGQLRL
jgi:hypothetical protein